MLFYIILLIFSGSVVEPDESLQTALMDRYHFQCECLLCSDKLCIPSKEELNFTKSQLFIDAHAVFSMKAEEFRKLPQVAIENHEKNVIKFLEKYGRFHPINETFVMQQALQIMWYLLSSRF